jgi:hypothetical protein
MRSRRAAPLGGRNQLEAGIGDQRRAGVGNQRQRFAFGEARDEARADLRRVVLVIGDERRGDLVTLQQTARDAGVLGQDRVGRRQRRQRPERDVGEIADRRRHDIEARRDRRGLDALAERREAARSRRARRRRHLTQAARRHLRPDLHAGGRPRPAGTDAAFFP